MLHGLLQSLSVTVTRPGPIDSTAAACDGKRVGSSCWLGSSHGHIGAQDLGNAKSERDTPQTECKPSRKQANQPSNPRQGYLRTKADSAQRIQQRSAARSRHGRSPSAVIGTRTTLQRFPPSAQTNIFFPPRTYSASRLTGRDKLLPAGVQCTACCESTRRNT